MTGPCLCCDPYCASCGDPHLAKVEEAEQAMTEAFAKEGFDVEDYQLVTQIGIATVKTSREIIKQVVGERLADSEQYVDYPTSEIHLLKEKLKEYEIKHNEEILLRGGRVT